MIFTLEGIVRIINHGFSLINKKGLMGTILWILFLVKWVEIKTTLRCDPEVESIYTKIYQYFPITPFKLKIEKCRLENGCSCDSSLDLWEESPFTNHENVLYDCNWLAIFIWIAINQQYSYGLQLIINIHMAYNGVAMFMDYNFLFQKS